MAQTTHHPRIHAPERELVPRILVRAMFGLVALCLVMVSFAVWTGRPITSTPPQSEITRDRVLFIKGDMSGAAKVLAADGTLIADLSPEDGGFVSGVWRVLQRERTNARVELDGPIRLVRQANGRVAIFDPSTGWNADLMGFGKDNAVAFARLLK